MSKKELIAHVATKAKITKVEASDAIDALFEGILDEVEKNGNITIVGFGRFEKKVREERQGRNPKTGETCTFAKSSTVNFKASKTLKTTG